MTGDVLCIILNYRTAEMTLRAVAHAVTAMDGMPGEILVVDNNSQDGSLERLRAGTEGMPRVSVVASPVNGGFGAGNNVGILAGPATEFVYILNSDAFPAADAIAKLRDVLVDTPRAGIAGSYIHGEAGEPHITAFRFPSISSELEGAMKFGPVSRLLGHKAVPLPLPGTSQEVDWLAGASMMMRRTMLEEIGLFDETFFLYFEETDLCLRAARAGWTCHYIRESETAHIGSVSTGMKQWTRIPGFWLDSRRHYFVKNHGGLYAALATLAHLAGGGFHRLRSVITRRDAGMPRHFLRDLATHEIKALFRRRPPSVPRLTERVTP